jgi:carbohydrate diacid regulator
MGLLKNIAQDIAKSTSDVIGFGVLVTDENGIVIGCNEDKRLGEFHVPSMKVMHENRPAATSSEDAEWLKDVRPGYTLPIQFFDKVIGSVSIAGLPEEVARYGLLVKRQAEMMLREEAFLESNLLRERALRDLVENVALFDTGSENEERIKLQGKELGFNLDKCRTAIVIEMKKWANEAAESAFQKMLREIRSCFSNPRNVICPQENYRATVFFSPCLEENPEKINQTAEFLSKSLIDSSLEMGVEVDVAVGLLSDCLAGLARSLRSARNALRIGKQLGAEGVIAARNFTGESLLDLLPLSKREEYASRTLKGITGRNDYGDIKKTFLAWCESPFASGNAAEKLSMHRNSLQYRLKKIRTLTGKDPWNFKEAFELWAAFTISDMSK